MRNLPETLPAELVSASGEGAGLWIFGGDLGLKRVKKEDLFYMYIRVSDPDFSGSEAVVLQTASGVYFAYDPSTGKEVGNTMGRCGIKDRADVARRLAADLRSDASYQDDVKGRPDFASFDRRNADILEGKVA